MVVEATQTSGTVTRSSGFARWWRRRPIRKSLVLTHRWTSLVLGLLLIAETTSGAVLLFNGELFRAGHQAFYQHTSSASPITAQRALQVVGAAHPDFGAAWVSSDDGVFAVGNADYTAAWSVDPGSGRIVGFAELQSGFTGWLANLHDCAFTCPTYPGYVPALAKPVPGLGELTWGALLLAVLGLLMVLLAVTGAVVWWPGIRRLRNGFRVRTGRGRFARDFDLHNVIGIVAVPFVFMWGVTGASFEVPAVQNTWLAITGGQSVSADEYAFAPDPRPALPHAIDADRAASVALARVPGEVRYLVSRTPEADYYTVSIATGYRPYDHRAFFGGDTTVYVDAHDPGHVKVANDAAAGGTREPAANRFYDRVFEASHFGWMVDGWWRIVWAAFGLAPLALAVTGVSTWLVRRSVRRRRRAA
jgi:uncharacterized iron-regulated membrane protein